MLNYIRSYKKNLNFAFCIVVFCCLLFSASNQAQAKSFNCLGHNWEQRIADFDFKIPKILDVEQESSELGVKLKANIDVDEEAKPFFYWCANQGSFEEVPGHNNYSEILYVPPEQVVGPIKVKAKLGDNLGAVDYELVLISLGSEQGDGDDENPEEPNDPDAPEDPDVGLSLPFSISPIDGALDVSFIKGQDFRLSWASNNSSDASYAVQLRRKPSHPFVNAFSDNCSDLQDPCILYRSDISSNSVNISSNLFEYETSYVWRIKALVRDLSTGQISKASPWSPNYSFATSKEPAEAQVTEVSLFSFTEAGDPIILINIDGQSLDENLGSSVINLIEDKFSIKSFTKVQENEDFDANQNFSYHLVVEVNHDNDDGEYLEFDINLPSGGTHRAKVFVEHDLKRFKNPELGFNQLNNIDIRDDFRLGAMDATLGLDGLVHVVAYKTKEEVDTRTGESIIQNKIVYLSLDTENNEFSFPRTVFVEESSNEDLNLDTGEVPVVRDLKIAVDKDSRRHVLFVERNAKNTKDTLYYVPHSLLETKERRVIALQEKIVNFDIKLVEANGKTKLLLAWAETDSQLLEQVSKFSACDSSDVSFDYIYQVDNGKSSSVNLTINQANQSLELYALQDGILHRYDLGVDNLLEHPLNAAPKWTNSSAWSKEMVFPEYIDKNQYKVKLDSNANAHLLWLGDSKHKHHVLDSATNNYRVLNSEDLNLYEASLFDFELEGDKLHLVSRSSDSSTKGLHYNFSRGGRFYGPSQISTSTDSLIEPNIILGSNKTRYIFYKAKDPDQSRSLYRLMTMIVPALSDEVDHLSSEYEPEFEDIEEHPNSLVCEENPLEAERVCGEDGITYPSECLAKKNFTKVAYQGLCQTSAELVYEHQDSFTKTTLGELASLTNFSYSFFFEVDSLNNLVMLESPFSPPERDFYQKLELHKLASKNNPVQKPGAKLRFLAKSQSGPVSCYSKRVVFPGERHHLALVYDEQKGLNLYVDGLLECSKDYPGPLLRNKRAFVGEIYGDKFEPVQFDGRFDNLKLYKFGLTEEEVQEHYELMTGNLPSKPSYEVNPFLDIDFEDASYNSSSRQYEVFDKSNNEFLLINEQHEYYDDRKRRRVYENAFEIIEEDGNKYALENVARSYLNLKIRDNGYIELPSNEISIAAWIKPASLSVIANQNDSKLINTSLVDLGLGFCELGSVRLEQDFVHLGWVHTACTYDGNELKLYINGELKASQKYIKDPRSYSLGLSINPELGLDDIKIFGLAINPEQISALVETKKDLIKKAEELIDIHNGLTAYYTFDSIFEDASIQHQDQSLKYFYDNVNGQNIKINRSRSRGQYYGYLAETVQGIVGAAAKFSGSDSAVIENTKHLGLRDRFTISYFLKGSNKVGSIFTRGDNYTNEKMSFRATSTYYSGLQTRFAFSSHISEDQSVIIESGSMPIDKWQLVTMVYDKGLTKIYSDGELLAERQEANINFNNHRDLPITFKFDVSKNYDGYSFSMDELRFYKRALAPAEVAELAKYYLAKSLGDTGKEDSDEKITIDNLGVFSMDLVAQDFGRGREARLTQTSDGLEVYAMRGDAYLFKSFDKSFLEGKKIRLRLTRPSLYSNEPIQAMVLDGKYDRSKDFPANSFTYKGNGVIQSLAILEESSEFEATQEIISNFDLANSSLNHSTLMIKVPESVVARIESVDILDQANKVIAIFDATDVLSQKSVASTSLGSDRARDEEAALAGPLKFSLELREHMYRGESGSYNERKYGPDVNFFSYYDNELKEYVLSLGNGIKNKAQGFIFKSFKKEFLNGKQVRVKWRPYGPCSKGSSNTNAQIAVFDGKFSRKQDQLFPHEKLILQNPLIVIDQVNDLSKSEELRTKSKRLSFVDQEGYATLMFKLEDFDTSCHSYINVVDVEIMNAYDELVARFSGGGPIKERQGTYMDYAITFPAVDDFAPPPVPIVNFAMELREHKHNRSSRSNPYFRFSVSKDRARSYSYSSSSYTGYTYIFKSFSKDFLHGKKIRFSWATNTSSRRSRKYSSYGARLIEGEYRADNDNLFRDGSPLYRRRGAWSKYFRYTKENLSEEFETEILDLSDITQDKVTFMFEAYDSGSNSEKISLAVNSIEILDEEDRVVAKMSNDKLVSQRNGGYGDFAIYDAD